jgi:predicted HAD superfamily Cof-like phosphohydrolase
MEVNKMLEMVASFMKACDQDVKDKPCNVDDAITSLRYHLLSEENREYMVAAIQDNKVEILDALVDILVVTIGAIHSMGSDAEGAWREVMANNFA